MSSVQVLRHCYLAAKPDINHNNSYCCGYNTWQTFSNSSDQHRHTHTHKKRQRQSNHMFYSLLNLSVIAVRAASTQQSPGLLQGLLNGFTSSSHSAAHTETLNTSLQSVNNESSLPLLHQCSPENTSRHTNEYTNIRAMT